jgi:UDP-glucose 4-epimerase
MKIFITGGAGYVGAALVKHLSDNKLAAEITVYDNFSQNNIAALVGNKLAHVKYVKADILDSRTLKKAMAGHDAVVHLAEAKDLTQAHQLEQVNHWGTAEVCYAVETLGIKNLVFLSSTKVYPYTSADGFVENTDGTVHNDAYSSSKLRGEEHVARFMGKKDFNAHVLRASSMYGFSPSLKFDSYLNKLMLDVHFFNRIQLFGTGFQQRSFVDIDNVVSVITALLQRKVASGIHNISEKTASPIDLIDSLKEVYPEMEFIFTSHHLTLPHIRVQSSESIKAFMNKNVELVETIKEMKEKFSI